VIAGGDIGFNAARFLQGFGNQLRGDLAGVNGLAIDLDGRIGDDIGRIERVLVTLGAVARIDIVDQTLVQRPGVDPSFPVIDDRVAETVDLGLLVRHARGKPGFLGCLERGIAGSGEKSLDCRIQSFRSRQRIIIFGLGNIGIMPDHGFRRDFGKSQRRHGRGGQKGCSDKMREIFHRFQYSVIYQIVQ